MCTKHHGTMTFSDCFLDDVKQSHRSLSHLYEKSRFLDKAGNKASVGAWVLSWGIPLWSEWLRCAAICLRGGRGSAATYSCAPEIRQTALPGLEGKAGLKGPQELAHPRWSCLSHHQSWSHSSSGQGMSPEPRWGWGPQPGWLSVSLSHRASNRGLAPLFTSPTFRGLPLSSLLRQVPLP